MNTNTLFRVGLTGGIGSGKTTVSDLFASLGVTIIDTNQIAHQLTAPDGAAIEIIRTTFGDRFITSTGAMDRACMRTLVFSNLNAKKQLEALLHPMIWMEAERTARLATGDYLILVVPLLIETIVWKEYISRTLVVDCTEKQQIQRVSARSQFTASQIQAIMATQTTRSTRLEVADDVIHNTGDPATLITQVTQLHKTYVALSKEKYLLQQHL